MCCAGALRTNQGASRLPYGTISTSWSFQLKSHPVNNFPVARHSSAAAPNRIVGMVRRLLSYPATPQGDVFAYPGFYLSPMCAHFFFRWLLLRDDTEGIVRMERILTTVFTAAIFFGGLVRGEDVSCTSRYIRCV